MLDQFKIWFTEIAQKAIDQKVSKASKKGNAETWKSEIWRSSDKNSDIKKRFRDEGAARGYKSRPSYVSGAGEWLYDFVWREFDEDERLVRVVLAMEIEVSACNPKSIRYDFNKLLQADAEYKILVFQQKTKSEVDSTFSFLQDSFSIYQKKSDSAFLICGWCTAENSFSFRELGIKLVAQDTAQGFISGSATQDLAAPSVAPPSRQFAPEH